MSERLSAWMDGELEGEQAQQLMAQLKRDGDIRGDWASYHLIGDTLRGIHGPDLSARILTRVDLEPTVLAPRRYSSVERLGKFASTAARLAAVAFVAIVVSKNFPDLQQKSSEIAIVPRPEVKQAAVQMDESAKDYLLAHQPYSPGNAMQGLAVYVRALSQEFAPAHRTR